MREDELAPGQVWAYCSEQGVYDDADDIVSTQTVVVEFYSLIRRVSYESARKPLGLGPKAARHTQFWHVAVTNATTGLITTRVQRFPVDITSGDYVLERPNGAPFYRRVV